MKKTTKIIILLMLILTIALGLAACTNSANNWTNVENSDIIDDSESTNKEENVTSGNGSVNSNGEVFKLKEIDIELNTDNGNISWNEITGAVKYELYFNQYLLDLDKRIEYETATNSYQLTSLKSGEYKLTVRALNDDGVEIGTGSLNLSLLKGINNLKAPVAQKNSGDGCVYTWNVVDGAKEYRIKLFDDINNEVVKFGDKEYVTVTGTTFDCEQYSNYVTSGKYIATICAVDDKNVEGDDFVGGFYVDGNINFNKLKDGTNNEYYIADYSRPDYVNFLTVVSNLSEHNYDGKGDAKYEYVDGNLYYENASWYHDSIAYILPEPILWESVYSLNVKFKTVGTGVDGVSSLNNSVCLYLFDENDYYVNLMPKTTDTAFGFDSNMGAPDSEGYYNRTAPRYNIEEVSLASNWHENEGFGNRGKYLSKILFSCANRLEKVFIEEVTYVKSTSEDEDFDLKVNGQILSTEIRNTDLINLTTLTAEKNGEKLNATIKLYDEKNNKVALEDEVRLPIGKYKIKVRLYDEKYYGTKYFYLTVTESPYVLPEKIKNLKFNEQTKTLSWDSVDDFTGYVVEVKNLNGDVIFSEEIYENSCILSNLTGGYFYFSVAAINGDVVGDKSYTNIVLNGNSNFAKKVEYSTNEAKYLPEQYVIADFNDNDYLNFIQTSLPNDFYTIENGQLTFNSGDNANWEEVYYILPEAIKTSDIYMFEARAKFARKSGNTFVLKFYNENDVACDVIMYGDFYYGIIDRFWMADNDYRCRFSFEAIKARQLWRDSKTDIQYRWGEGEQTITKIGIQWRSKDNEAASLDYIHFIKQQTTNMGQYSENLGGTIVADLANEQYFDAYYKMILCGQATSNWRNFGEQEADEKVFTYSMDNVAWQDDNVGSTYQGGYELFVNGGIAMTDTSTIEIKFKGNVALYLYNEKYERMYFECNNGVVNTGNVTELADGWYKVTLSQSDFAKYGAQSGVTCKNLTWSSTPKKLSGVQFSALQGYQAVSVEYIIVK